MSDHDLPDHDPQLSALYRRASGEEPSTQLDAQILAQAGHRAARRRQRRWLPLATAAVVVLAVGVLLHHPQRPDELMPQVALDMVQERVPAKPAPMVVEKAPASREEPKSVREEMMAREEQAERSRVLADNEQRAKSKAEAMARRQLAEEVPEREGMAEAYVPTLSAGVAASTPAPATTLDLADEAQRVERAPLAAAPATQAAPLEKQAAAPATQTAPLEKQAAAPEAPEAWLKRIEALRVKGDIDAARRELAAFRKVYPAWNLPKELLPLLPEGGK